MCHRGVQGGCVRQGVHLPVYREGIYRVVYIPPPYPGRHIVLLSLQRKSMRRIEASFCPKEKVHEAHRGLFGPKRRRNEAHRGLSGSEKRKQC